MTRRISVATTIAAVAILSQGLQDLAPAAQADSVSVSVAGGNTLQVVGDGTDNSIHESLETDPACPGGSPCDAVWSEGTALIPLAPCIESDLQPGTGSYRALCPAGGITGLVEFGNGGEDQFYGDLGVPTDIRGGAGRDAIAGGSANDILIGGAGNDKLIGGPGDDLLKGNAGNDGMDGRVGNDRCVGGPGRDTPRHCERVRSVP